MIARSYQPNGLNCSVSSSGGAIAPDSGVPDCFAAASDSGETVVLRCVNEQPTSVTAAVSLAGAAAGAWSVEISTMHGESPTLNNTPAQPRLVAPVQKQPSQIRTLMAEAAGQQAVVGLPPFSFTVATMTRKADDDLQ
jgi:alpha-L-arabinofuranosidase